jgi:AcrR family transcriptional regulator
MVLGAVRGNTADPSEAVRAGLISAARRCFARYGVRRTTMEDVAVEAGFARATLYKLVPGRAEVIEAVIMQRLTELAEGWREILVAQRSVAQALVETSLAIVETVRHDPELRALFETTTGTRLIRLLAGPQPAVRGYVIEFYAELFARGRASGELRDDVTDEQLADWIRGIILMLILREDLTPHEERRMIESFLLPSLGALPST